MAHYALIDSNSVVVNVFVGKDEGTDGVDWEAYYAPEGFIVRRTSFNTYGGVHYDELGLPSLTQEKAIRKNYAGIGFTYDSERDAFIPPQPFISWVLNNDTCQWEAPVPMPDDNFTYTWDEETVSWVRGEPRQDPTGTTIVQLGD